MNEDSYLDSFMESHIGGWTGDEDARYDNDEQDDNWWADRYEDDADEYDDHEDDRGEYDFFGEEEDPEYDNYDDPNDY